MSSHREAPEISKDPVADNTDVYAFVSPDKPDTVTLIANYVPLQAPAGGPNFFEFGDDVLYEINSTTTATARPTSATSSGSTPSPEPEHVPLQHRPDQRHRRRELEPHAVLHGHPGQGGKTKVLGTNLPARRATSAAQHAELRRLADAPSTPSGAAKVFAGQRDEASTSTSAHLRPRRVRPFNTRT